MARVRVDSLKMVSGDHPGWRAPVGGRIPEVGERVLCADGEAEVTQVLGRTGDGSRLLELCLPERPKHHPFFASSSNVLVRERGPGSPPKAPSP